MDSNQQSNSQNSPTPELPKEKNFFQRNKLLIIAISAILIALFIGVNIYVRLSINSLYKEASSIDDIQPSSVSLSPTPDPTVDWQTYTSDNQMDIDISYFKLFPSFKDNLSKTFTFKYPSTWKIIESKDVNTYKREIFILELRKEDPQFSPCKSEGPCDNSAYIQLWIGTMDQPVADFDSDFWGKGFIIAKKSNIEINRIKATQAFVSNDALFPTATLYKFETNAQMYASSYFHSKNNELNTVYTKQTINEINGILSTFKFID